MKITVDLKDIEKLNVAMGRYAQIMPTSKANSVLRKAAKPMLSAAQSEVPVSRGDQESVSLNRARREIKAHRNPNGYRRGGATRRDLRIKAVQPKAGEIGRVLVGVSKRRGKVGWRTVFITTGATNRKTKKGKSTGSVKANKFLDRAYDSTIDFVRVDFQQQYREAFVSWARSNWPQIGV